MEVAEEVEAVVVVAMVLEENMVPCSVQVVAEGVVAEEAMVLEGSMVLDMEVGVAKVVVVAMLLEENM